MSGEVALLWVLGGLIALACLVFIAIFVKFVTKASVDYAKKKPVGAAAVFSASGGSASFLAAFFGTGMLVATIIGLVAGIAVFLLVAVEMGHD